MRFSVQIKDWIDPGKIFVFLSAAIFILLPLLSTNAGISGDEPVHYQHAEYVYNYFKTDGEDQSAIITPKTHLKYYGQVVDNISYYINHALNSQRPYLTRHILNSIIGALMILFTGLIAVTVSGYRAGIIALIFLFLSPRILGHSYNNLKDIPFAAGYIVGIYGLAGAMTSFPKIKILHWLSMCLGLALAFGTRAGGLILIPVYLFFIFLTWATSHPVRELLKAGSIKKGLVFLSLALLASAAGFFIGIALWPYALQAPFRHSLESLSVMTHYTVSIRQLFEGQWLWSENLPAYYPLKYILITSPLVIIAGFFMQFFSWNKRRALVLAMLNFSALFPIIWVMLKGSNLYGAWRHLLFVYPAIVVVSAVSWEAAVRKRGSLVKILAGVILIAGMTGPLFHIVKNHPVEYVYFNRLTNGVRGAFSRYETDYYYHSMGPAVKWLKSYLSEKEGSDEIKVASNFPLDPYFKGESNIRPVYTHFMSRSKYDWDYGIFTNTFLGPDFLKSENWPPENTIYTFKIEGKVICSVVKRPSKLDLRGIELYRNSRFGEAITDLNKALEYDPGNLFIKLYIAWAFRQTGDLTKSDSLVSEILRQQPLNDMALDLYGRNKIREGDFNEALSAYERLRKNNYKYLPLYDQAASAADSLGDYAKAAGILERGIQLGLNKPEIRERLDKYLNMAEMKAQGAKIQNNSK